MKDWCPYKKTRDNQRQSHVVTEAEIGDMHLQVKEC